MATNITNTSITTDNLTVADNVTVDTDTIHVDSSNNSVGIGTTSPAKPLHVEGGADYNMIVRSASNRSGLAIHQPGTGALGSPLGSALVLASDNTFRLGTQSVYNIIMDQSGRVTMPNQPAWFGTHADNYATTFNGGTAFNMIANTANSYNVGNHFDFSTDRFTAPVAGYYLVFGWDIRESGREATGVGVGVYKNGFGGSDRVVNSYHQNQRGYAFSSVISLAVNDWISFGVTEGGGVAGLFYGSGSYSGYGIRLLG